MYYRHNMTIAQYKYYLLPAKTEKALREICRTKFIDGELNIRRHET